MTRHDTAGSKATAAGWPCSVCHQLFPVLYGLAGDRCIDCWVVNPGYDRPDSDPYMGRLRQWAAAINHERNRP